ncbi:holo-ACP synthase [Oceanobacillus bengalensis]|uniref:Holo-[acyl-carrier-protein] synthase n=1 Tax=Oceanobacillus bengalensis TaxID=1435466 RepID=A0A494YRV7_9BACI|nr:holo-ACP synthase [Oceanobacillus bengalensis]RKQ12367.1 holo-[acyl-carrier-protein] synthase [Oceanobacillus bengalensis]
MIKGIGIDIIELERIEVSVRSSAKLAGRILTENEKKIYDNLKSESRKVEFLAGRFAAKEAIAKAFGTGIGKLSFKHMEVLPDTNGAPEAKVKNYEESRIFISITHSRDYAVAQAVIEGQ